MFHLLFFSGAVQKKEGRVKRQEKDGNFGRERNHASAKNLGSQIRQDDPLNLSI